MSNAVVILFVVYSIIHVVMGGLVIVRGRQIQRLFGLLQIAIAKVQELEGAGPPGDLTSAVARAIGDWIRVHPDITARQILSALEGVRHSLTEELLKEAEAAGDALPVSVDEAHLGAA